MLRPRCSALLLVGGARRSVMAAGVAGCRRDGCVGGDDGPCLRRPPARRCATAATVGELPAWAQVDVRALPRSPKARGAPVTSCWKTSGPRRARRAGACVRSGASGGRDSRPRARAAGSKRPDDSIYQVAGVLPRDVVHYEGEPTTNGTATTRRTRSRPSSSAATWRRTAGSRSSPATRCVFVSPACGCGPTSTTAHPSRTRCTSRTRLSGATTPLVPVAPGPGLGIRAPALDLDGVDERWREWPILAARSQGPPDASSRPCLAIAIARGIQEHPTLTVAGVPLRPRRCPETASLSNASSSRCAGAPGLAARGRRGDAGARDGPRGSGSR